MTYTLTNISTGAGTLFNDAIVSLEGSNIVVYQDIEDGAILGIFPTAAFYCVFTEPK